MSYLLIEVRRLKVEECVLVKFIELKIADAFSKWTVFNTASKGWELVIPYLSVIPLYFPSHSQVYQLTNIESHYILAWPVGLVV